MLSKLEQQIFELAQRLWPEMRITPRLRPSLDPGRGSCFADFCLDLGAKLKLAPQILAEKFAQDFSQNSGIQVQAQSGYLNFFVPSDKISDALQSEDPTSIDSRPRFIIAAPFSLNANALTHFRVGCNGLLQALFLNCWGVRSRLFLVNQEIDLTFLKPSVATKQQGVACALRSLISACSGVPSEELLREAQLAEIIIGLNNEKEPVRMTLWTSIEIFRRESLERELSRAGDVASAGNIGTIRVVKVVDKPTLTGFDKRIDLGSFSSWSDKELCDLLLYFCTSVPSADLDLNVPRFRERANLGWFVSATIERIQAIVSDYKSLELDGNELPNLPNQVERSALESCERAQGFLESFFRFAASDAEVVDFIEALDFSLAALNQLFNMPSFRQRLSKGQLNRVELNIMSGAAGTLSDIIRKIGFLI